ncbi:MAG: DUF421 domain-containing protein [Oscillospiraceae bacterium]|nr:DUF421 domain-containing protein [Ruminococcus sp.]MDE6706711.1 DUF421 domain-containing protein [Oscillospiraceae bacterium]
MTIVLIRSFILYLIVIFSVRLMGKRQLGELQPSELVITILISNIATLALEDINIPLLHGILPILALVCYEVLVSWISLKSIKIRRLISGSPKIIIRDGILDQNMLKTLRFSVDDVMTALRMNGIFFIEDVQFAIVETNGSISVYQKSSEQPATKEDVHTAKKNVNPPQIIIADGKLREHALSSIGQDKKWLDLILKTTDISIAEIFMMTADNACRYHIIKKG